MSRWAGGQVGRWAAPRRDYRRPDCGVLTGLLIVLVLGQALPAVAWATNLVCSDLSETTVGLGEARYRILGSSYGSNTAYANAYYNGGDELSITQTFPVGWAGATTSYFPGFTSVIEDLTASNCGNVTISMYVYTRTGGCAQGTYRGFAQHKINTCNLGNGNSDFYFGNLFDSASLTGNGSFYYRIRVYDFNASPTLRAEDEGCFNVGTSALACY